MRRHLDSPRLKPRTSPYSHVVIADRDCFIAGIVAADIPGGDAVIGNVEEETDLVMRTIEKILSDHGMSMTDLVRVDVHLADLDEIHVMDRAYGRYLDPDAMPARTFDRLVAGSLPGLVGPLGLMCVHFRRTPCEERPCLRYSWRAAPRLRPSFPGARLRTRLASTSSRLRKEGA